jgi:ubiquinone/menaquinone biosynthesis C-methylase UbiE
MKHGDFSELAKAYINRPGYSKEVLKAIFKYGDMNNDSIVYDVGAGTGKLTLELLELGFNVKNAVEPNKQMREEGISFTSNYPTKWLEGSGESISLEDNSANWILMGSSFHWTDHTKSLPEFSRLLKSGGFFTAIWNPRDIEKSDFHQNIENIIHSIVPNIKRVSSGSSKNMEGLERKLLETGHFDNLIFIEAPHKIIMTKERYMGAWESVNDIRVQAGEEKWQTILSTIRNEIKELENIEVPYKTRSWTVRKID